MAKHIYNLKKQFADHRDKKYARSSRFFLPQSVDLRNQMPLVVDQGQLGSCTANALAGYLGFLEMKEKGVSDPLSRLFIYWNERNLEGTVNQDAGAVIRDGIKTLAQFGVCIESIWQYDIALFTFKPTSGCYSDAYPRRISSYEAVNGLSDMLDALANGFPVVFGISIFDSFESDSVAQSGIVPMPGQDETLLGGHCVLGCGFDLKNNRILVRNSWGSQWAISGYFWLPFDYINRFSSDAWVIKVEGGSNAQSNGSISNGISVSKSGICGCIRKWTKRFSKSQSACFA